MLPHARTHGPGLGSQRETRLGPRRQDTARRSRDAFTLLEVLVVMAIMAAMAGITAASYVGVTRRASREGARGNIMDVLRQARVSAVDTGRGAVVRIDPATGSIYGIATDVIGAWHFEEVNGTTTPGARRYDGALKGTIDAATHNLVAGKLGIALHFNGTDNYVDCGSAPVWNQGTGVRLEAWVRPTQAAQMYIIAKTDGAGRGYSLGTDPDAPNNVFFGGGVAFKDANGTVGGIYVKSAQSYPIGDWYNVAFEFDGFEARLFVNGVLADLDSWREPEPASPQDPRDNASIPSPPGPGPAAFVAPAIIYWQGANPPLTIGCLKTTSAALPPPTGFFAGDIDEPRVLSVAGGSPVTLPEHVQMVTSNQAVYYDAQGFLNLAYHTGPVNVTVGDPYQAAELTNVVPNSNAATTLKLRPNNPFPPTGGLVLVGNEVIFYDNAAGADLNVLAANGRGQYGTPISQHNPGDKVYFARVTNVGTTGLVTMVVRP
jgi:prepilin-type N-terminal cleavage/methylation domain-containing protein